MADPPNLKLIGYWARSERPSVYPHPKALVRPEWRAEDRGRIVAYLRAGAVLQEYCGFSCCRFCEMTNGSRELTDGEWVWPEGLPHYVEAHQVCLPDEVVVAMEARSWQVPANPTAGGYSTVDESFWVGWATRLKPAEPHGGRGFLHYLADCLSPTRRARARRREVELDFRFYCHVCGRRRVRLACHENEAFCSADCRHLRDVAVCYFAHAPGAFSDREVFESTGLRVRALPRRFHCKWCGHSAGKVLCGPDRCAACGGGSEHL